jgi:hypothetical protein
LLCEYLPTNLRVFPDARAAHIRHTVLRREATADASGILEDAFQMEVKASPADLRKGGKSLCIPMKN